MNQGNKELEAQIQSILMNNLGLYSSLKIDFRKENQVNSGDAFTFYAMLPDSITSKYSPEYIGYAFDSVIRRGL